MRRNSTLSLAVATTALCALAVQAQTFNPVPLMPGSYTQDIVVESNTPPPQPYAYNCSQGSGLNLGGDYTLFEQGLYHGYPYGMPPHGSTFTHLSNPSIQYVMPPDYTVNNCLFIDASVTYGTLTFNTPATATNLSFLGTSGGGATTIDYLVTHADFTTESGTISFGDWWNGANFAWTNSGRIYQSGAFNNIGAADGNPRLYSTNITVSGTSPVTSIDFYYNSGGGHAGIYAVSGNNGGSTWTPIPVGGFNEQVIVAAAFPLTATMDQGTNTLYNGNLATWFEQGFAPANPDSGLPHPGALLTNMLHATHVYQMAPSYAANNAILIDANHPVANITPAAADSYTAIALLTAGGNIGGANIMTNQIILQHANGVAETNLFFGYDWFATNAQIAYVTGGRVNMAARTLDALGDPTSLASNPKLFESTFGLTDTASPVTNIVLKYLSAPGASSTTYVLAVSASAGAVAPVVFTQTPFVNAFVGGNASFSVQLSAGSTPLTYLWQTNGVTLTDGGRVSGASTPNLTLSGVGFGDAGTVQVIITNVAGATTSAPIVLTVMSTNADVTTPGDPVAAYQPNGGSTPANEAVFRTLDNTTTKYLNFGGNNGAPFYGPVGFVVTPLQGRSTLTGIRLYTANDATARDPIDYTIEGSDDGSNFTYLTSGSVSLPLFRNAADQPLDPLSQALAESNFANATAYSSYRVYFYDVRDAANANSLQIGEVELLGTLEPTSPVLLSDIHPTNTMNFEGLVSSLSVTASGSSPLFYQWKVNGVPIPEATNATCSFVTLAGTNNYSCTVSNSINPPATSSTATVVGVPTSLASTFVVNFHDAMGAQYAASADEANANLWTNVTYTGLGAYPDLPANTNWNGFGFANGYAPTFDAGVAPQRASDGSPIPVTLTVNYSGENGFLAFYGDGTAGNTCADCPSLVLGYTAVANPGGTFVLHNVPPGSYTLYLYSANFDNTRGAKFTLNSGGAHNGWDTCTNNPANGSPANAFIEGSTYVYFTNVTPNVDATITGSFVGFYNPISALSGEANFNGLQLIKTATTRPTLSIESAGDSLTISWSPSVGVLQSAPNAAGPYTDVSGASSPYVVPVAGAQKFYRLRL